MPPTPQQFKDYLLLRELGRGGMGVVYHARHQQTGEDCALKLLLQPTDERAITRFQREAKALSLVDHPHVISIFEHGQFNGVPYIAMELVRGESLQSIVEDAGKRVVSKSYQNWMAGIVHAIAKGLRACHEQGLTHRDIKPDNILVEEKTGRPVLIDFGLVKKDKVSGRFDSVSLTQSGAVLGTIHYMAPEQLDSEEFGQVGSHSDVWALGATFLYSLTGELPFKGDSVITIYTAIIMGDPPKLQSMIKSAPPWLNQLCSDCLVKKAENRIKLDAFIQLLNRPEPVTDFAKALDSSQLESPVPDTLSARTAAKTFLGLCTVALLSLLIFLFVGHRPDPVTIEVYNPQQGQELYAHAALFQGKVSKVPATVTIEGKTIEVNHAGHFQALVELPQGKQDISMIVRTDDGAILTVVKDVQATLSPKVLSSLETIGEDAVPALMRALKDRNQFIQLAAAETLAKIGKNARAATPSLINALRDGRKDLKKAAALALGRIGQSAVPSLLGLLKTNNEDKVIRVAIFKAFEIMGPQAKEAVPVLIEALRDRERAVTFAASTALSKIGELAISQLIDSAKNEDQEIRLAAVTGLGALGAKSKPSIEALARALKDEQLIIRQAATDYIGLVGPGAKIAIPELIVLTRSRDKALKDMSLRALGNIGEAAISAVPAVTECLNDAYPFARKTAAEALGKIGPGAKSAIPAMLKLTQVQDKSTRDICSQALARIGKESIPELIEALNIENRWTRECCAEALATIGADAIAPLIKFLNGKSQPGHAIATEALGKMGLKAKAAIPTLLETLESQESTLRYGSVCALGQIGLANPATIKALTERLKDKNKIIQWAAATAIGQLKPKPEAAIPELLLALQSDNESLQCAAAEALGKLGRPAKKAIPTLIEMLGHPRQRQRSSATKALPGFGKAAIEPLLAALRDDNTQRRFHAALAIGQLGTLAVPTLTEALRDPNSEVGSAAARALGLMRAASKDAVPALIQALKNKNIRTNAMTALENIGQVAVPQLIEGLKNRESYTWESRVQILGKIGAPAKNAVPALILALKDKDPSKRSLAALVLGQIGPDANNAVRALTKALKDPNASVRENVLIAISRIEGSD